MISLWLSVVWAGIIAALALSAAHWLRTLPLARGRRRVLAWGLLIAPLITPSLLVSYTYSRWALNLIATPGWNLAFYSLILLFKLAPVAALARFLLPPSISGEALHC